jgi:signal peptidase I
MKRRHLVRVSILAALLGVWIFSPWRVGVVLGHSMDPTLRSGQLIAIERDYYRHHRPRAGEIVVFRHAGMTYVKRVYAAEGQTIYLVAEGARGERTLIRPICAGEEASVRSALRRAAMLALRRLRVPEGSFFALGDALSCSIDSRDLGLIESGELIGRVRPLFGRIPATGPDYSFHVVRPSISRSVHAGCARLSWLGAPPSTRRPRTSLPCGNRG